MTRGEFWKLAEVPNERLRAELTSLVASGARTEARVIAHLAELEQRQLHLIDGASSLFDYCKRRLGLSDNEAYYRITGARVARRFPVIFGMLERRELHLTAVCLMRDFLTPANHIELLSAATHKTKLEILEILASRFPKPSVPSIISRHNRASSHCRRASTASSSTPAWHSRKSWSSREI